MASWRQEVGKAVETRPQVHLPGKNFLFVLISKLIFSVKSGKILPSRAGAAPGGPDAVPDVLANPERHQEWQTAMLLRHACPLRSLSCPERIGRL